MQTTWPPVAAVLFDFGMVLSGPPVPAVWHEMQRVSGLDAATLEKLYWAHRDDYDQGNLDAVPYWQRIAETADVTLSPDQRERLIALDVDLWTDMNMPMLAWVAALHRAGVRTGILSNMGDGMAQGIRRRFDWISSFDHCVWSHALRMRKPEPAIYAAAAQGLGVAPEHILFLDDKGENIEAAERFGMQAIRFTTYPALVNELERRGQSGLLDPAPAARAG